MNHKELLIQVCKAYADVRNKQHTYFATVKNNKTPGKTFIDPLPKLQESRDAEKQADSLVKQVMDELNREAKANQQPELFGRR